MVFAWLCGSWVGLKIPINNKEMHFAALALLSVYVFYAISSIFPFQMFLLPIYLLLISCSSSYAGYFFKEQRRAFDQVKYLFLWEMVGFIFGFIFSFLAFIFWGNRLVLFGPLLTFLLVFTCFILKNYVVTYKVNKSKRV